MRWSQVYYNYILLNNSYFIIKSWELKKVFSPTPRLISRKLKLRKISFVISFKSWMSTISWTRFLNLLLPSKKTLLWKLFNKMKKIWARMIRFMNNLGLSLRIHRMTQNRFSEREITLANSQTYRTRSRWFFIKLLRIKHTKLTSWGKQ